LDAGYPSQKSANLKFAENSHPAVGDKTQLPGVVVGIRVSTAGADSENLGSSVKRAVGGLAVTREQQCEAIGCKWLTLCGLHPSALQKQG